MKELIDHIREFANELSSDLETGSHRQNNQAHEVFWHSHPALSEWVKKLNKMADKAEAEGHNQKWIEEAVREIFNEWHHWNPAMQEQMGSIAAVIRKHLPRYDMGGPLDECVFANEALHRALAAVRDPAWVEAAAAEAWDLLGNDEYVSPRKFKKDIAAIIRKHLPEKS